MCICVIVIQAISNFSASLFPVIHENTEVYLSFLSPPVIFHFYGSIDSDPINRSVLHYAVLSGSVAIVNLLLKQGARVIFEPTYNKPTPLDLAILKGDVEMVRLILEHSEFFFKK